MIAVTATVNACTRKDIIRKLDMNGCTFIHESPDRPNIYYSVKLRTNLDTDLANVVDDLKTNSVKALRVIIYCKSLNMCADLYAHFLYELGSMSYYPPGAEETASNRLFGMYHSSTSPHNKAVILKSMEALDGTIRVVFATNALGMGVNFAGVNTVIHYGAPHSLDDYLQESGRGGRTGEKATSTIYWCASDAKKYKEAKNKRMEETLAVRLYLENTTECRRHQLLRYFNQTEEHADNETLNPLCCDVCRDKKVSSQNHQS